jgi:hypothetical protein
MIVVEAVIAVSKARARYSVGHLPARWFPAPVIPSTWTPVHRPEDGEHVGYLSPDGVPRLLTGATLTAPAADPHDLLLTSGLRALDRRWWCRLPAVLPDGITDAATPTADWEWRSVVLVEVSPTTCTVRPEWPAPEELSNRAVLPTPVGDLLREG